MPYIVKGGIKSKNFISKGTIEASNENKAREIISSTKVFEIIDIPAEYWFEKYELIPQLS
jgi:hypothetical protein